MNYTKLKNEFSVTWCSSSLTLLVFLLICNTYARTLLNVRITKVLSELTWPHFLGQSLYRSQVDYRCTFLKDELFFIVGPINRSLESYAWILTVVSSPGPIPILVLILIPIQYVIHSKHVQTYNIEMLE